MCNSRVKSDVCQPELPEYCCEMEGKNEPLFWTKLQTFLFVEELYLLLSWFKAILVQRAEL